MGVDLFLINQNVLADVLLVGGVIQVFFNENIKKIVIHIPALCVNYAIWYFAAGLEIFNHIIKNPPKVKLTFFFYAGEFPACYFYFFYVYSIKITK